jgi:hypothetical protein
MKRTTFIACLLLGQAMTADGQQPGTPAGQQLAASGKSQPTAADQCNYDRCALRFTLGFGSWSVVQGIDSRKVGRLGMFRGPNVERLVMAVPEAASEARRFRRGYARSSALLWGGAALVLIGTGVAADNDGNAMAIGLGATGLAAMAYGAWSHGNSFNRLSRSLWLYNRSLQR